MKKIQPEPRSLKYSMEILKSNESLYLLLSHFSHDGISNEIWNGVTGTSRFDKYGGEYNINRLLNLDLKRKL